MHSTRLSHGTVALIVLAFLPLAVALQGEQAVGGTGDGGSGRGSAGSVPNQTTIPYQTPYSPPQGQVLLISGVVVLEDGTPPPFGTVIERDCGASVTKEAPLDADGHFSFQAGSTNGFGNMFTDASDPYADGQGGSGNDAGRPGPWSSIGSVSSVNLSDCRLRARFQGYRSSTVRLQVNSMSRQVDVGTIVLYPIARMQGSTVSATSLQAPKRVQKALKRAQEAFKKKEVEEAEKHLKAAVESYPKYAEAWFFLGRVYEQQQCNQEARSAYRKAVEADPMYVDPYIRLARLAGLEQKWQEVANFTDRALELDTLDSPVGYFLNALAYYSLDSLDVAERSARKAQVLDARHWIPQIHLLLANILSRKRDIVGSTDEMRNYLKFAPAAADADEVRARLQENEKLLTALPNNRLQHK